MPDRWTYQAFSGAVFEQHHMWYAESLTTGRGRVLQQGCRHKSNRACRAKKNGAVMLKDLDFQPRNFGGASWLFHSTKDDRCEPFNPLALGEHGVVPHADTD